VQLVAHMVYSGVDLYMYSRAFNMLVWSLLKNPTLNIHTACLGTSLV